MSRFKFLADKPLSRNHAAADIVPEEYQLMVRASAEYEVRCILADRTVDGQKQYLIKWVGFTETSWEPKESLSCPDKLKQYLDAKKARAKDERKGRRWLPVEPCFPEPTPSVPRAAAGEEDKPVLKKQAKYDKNVLADHLKNMLTLQPNSHVVSKELLLKVCAVIGQADTTPNATKDLSQQIGYAMPLAFPNNPETWKSRKTRSGANRANSYRGVAFTSSV